MSSNNPKSPGRRSQSRGRSSTSGGHRSSSSGAGGHRSSSSGHHRSPSSGGSPSRDGQGSSGGNKPSGLEELFHHFASFGDRDCQGTITLKNIDKWWAQAHLFDKQITNADTAIYFSKVARNKKRITLSEFKEFLQTVAQYKNVDVGSLTSKLESAGAPRLSRHTEPISNSTAAENMERLTDTSLYTGSHKERFDDTGHGKGLAGRFEIVDNDGYVRGYKNKDTYEKEPDDEGRST